jgi:pyruvate/2-oxoglutarate dehydrogenase complex dihydrolipoamide dehydrogenase (E3) component
MLSTSSPEVGYLEGIRTSNAIAIDLLLLGTGVRPNSEIASAAGIELGVANEIKVDEHMITNVPDIFAAEDCATARNYIINEDVYCRSVLQQKRNSTVKYHRNPRASFRSISWSCSCLIISLNTSERANSPELSACLILSL